MFVYRGYWFIVYGKVLFSLTSPSSLKLGEVFMHFPNDEVQQYVEEAKTALQEGLTSLRESQVDVKKTLSELKVQLYAKFGDNINLEDDSSES